VVGRHLAAPRGGGGARITFAMDGVARTGFLTNRIGLCVLHPIRHCAGRPCAVEHTDGSVEHGVFPDLIAPHQPFKDVRAITHEPVKGVRVEVRFDGDVFETEDQRNWTDGSFKTYSRPLERPFPYRIEAGERVRQVVTVTVEGLSTGVSPSTSRNRERVVTVSDRVAARMPLIGVSLPHPSNGTGQWPLPEPVVARLRAMDLGFVRLELDWSVESRWGGLPPSPFKEMMRIGKLVEVALHYTTDAEAELARLVDSAIRKTLLGHHVSWWCVHSIGDPMTPVPLAERVRRRLKGTGPYQVGSGTVGSFAELNRNRPPAGSTDFLAFPVNPQVHAGDDLSLVENLQAQGDAVRTARSFAAGVPIRVGLVTLHRRPDPFAAGGAGTSPEAVRPDPRQRTPFGAAWTLGSIKYLAEAGADSISYYETSGPFGVMDDTHRPYPLYDVLRSASAFRCCEVLEVSDEHPLCYTALAVRNSDTLRILVANFRPVPTPVTLVLPSSARRVVLEPHEVRVIDEPVP
jgi:hypothetical protein